MVMKSNNWEAVIGLEVHIQLLTKSKLFSGAATTYGAAPNTQASEIDLGLPGTLPVLNEEAVKMAVLFGLSIGASIAPKTVWDRKHYFYPDLPKGYQISQFDQPIVGAGGSLMIELESNKTKSIRITRAHLEEDAGKSLHEGISEANVSGIDFNRAGVPLLEIVSEPELHSAQEAVSYLKTLHTLVRYLNICDGNLQEGSFRCDANVSVRPKGSAQLGVRAEIKNLNSFRFLEKAILVEIERQIEALERGETLIQETRSYDATENQTRSLRVKESAEDYRYIPDPDLCPLVLSPEFVAEIAASLPELPDAKRVRFEQFYGLSAYDAGILTSQRELAHYFELLIKEGAVSPKLAANWVLGALSAALNQSNLEITQSRISATRLVDLLKHIEDGTLSDAMAKIVFEKLWKSSDTVAVIISQEGLQQLTDISAIEDLVNTVLAQHPEQIKQYRAGKAKNLLGFFVGRVMKLSKGKCHPVKLNEILRSKLIG